MATLNQVACLGAIGNTGVGTCNYNEAPYKWAILIPKNEVITAANAVNFESYLTAKLINNSPDARWRIIGPFRTMEEAGREEQSETFDDGYKAITADPTESTIYTIIGSSCAGKNLDDFNGQQDIFDVLYVDKSGVVLGQQVTNATTGDMEIGGFPMDMLSVKLRTKATYAATARYRVEILHVDARQLVKNRAVIDCSNFRWAKIQNTYGVQNVSLLDGSSSVAGTHTFTALGSCGNANLGLLFKTKLNATARWIVTNAATGAVKAVTSFTIDTNGAITVVIPTPGAAGTQYLLTSAGVTDWASDGMSYYEVQFPLLLTIIA